jgi:hypothetical protein
MTAGAGVTGATMTAIVVTVVAMSVTAATIATNTPVPLMRPRPSVGAACVCPDEGGSLAL